MLTAWTVVWQAGDSFLSSQLVLMLVILATFYLIVLRPTRKKQQDMLNHLKNGDQVLTSGGIYGTVVAINDDRIQLRVADSVKIQVAKSAITERLEETSKRS